MTNPTGTTGTGDDIPEGQDSRQAGQGQPAGQPSTGITQDTGTADEPDFKALHDKVLIESRKWEARAKQNADKAKKWDDAEAANRTTTEKATDRAEKAEARAQAAVIAAVNAEIRAAARNWATPADAPRYLDDKTKYVTDDGEIDTAAIATDVAAVLADRPHLAAPTGAEGRRGPAPDPSQGHHGTPALTEQIRAAEAKGDIREALALKTQQLLGTRTHG